jgi:1,2-phenylacetyl-CoA epoxidase PaaB subunit
MTETIGAREIFRTDVNQILEQRGSTHGSYRLQGSFAAALKAHFRAQEGYIRLEAWQKDALDMIAVKISRILHGNPDVKDHWDDIAGYATLCSKELEKDSVAVGSKE